MTQKITQALAIFALLFVAAIASILLVVALASPRLPEVKALADYRPKVPLRVMTADGVLIGEFGEERRSVIRAEQAPGVLVNAILAAEDERFFEHVGIDPWGILRSATTNLLTASKAQGASTITMQVARNFYLSTEKTFTRKLFEVLLAIEIERKLSKNQILELYLNQIFLGRRAYGFAAASQIYFNKPVQRVSLAEAAMLAGLPKAPSAFNPVVNPRRAKVRQEYVLGRMLKLGMITEAEFRRAILENLKVMGRADDYAVNAAYLAEMVRIQIYNQFREEAYNRGLTVFTTVRSYEQRAAYDALRSGLLNFDRKLGWRGPEARIELPPDAEARQDAVDDVINDKPDSDRLFTAVVTEVAKDKVVVSRSQGRQFNITGNGLQFARKGLETDAPQNLRLRPGAVVRIGLMDSGEWEITQLPEVEGAFVALQADTGAVRALVGGFDFRRSEFNNVTQAYRQPGSTLKPFVYGAALEKGFSPATLINDAPVSFDPGETGGEPWEPKNYDDKYEGVLTMRQALAKSKNMVSIRILNRIGPRFGQSYLSRFGFEAERNPPYLTLALGAGGVTPMQMATGYAAIANGGFRVTPYFIDRVIDESGNLLSQTEPARAEREAPRIIEPQDVFILNSMLQDVIRVGTGRKALSLGRADLAGKTGTTNNAQDAWFAGYQRNMAALAWVGYDQPRSLGERETGGGLALPIWIDFMQEALKKVPVSTPEMPASVLRINGEFYTASSAPGVGVSSLGLEDPVTMEELLFQKGQTGQTGN
ncbi:MAG: penicillin-binding protein 1A [Proteobacteria bacterium]|nr:penicillin-binding protein 1A [Pseudomonadota bacterium]MDP4618778.1 penicillin-binding protein 1A [Burkholderiaceae bacterium]MDA0876686.1 penicillin-binding protein 1A [Pseudomonadota bacterium]MDP4677245.1 penicillin-binding protein 1A [Burkholderiaceae bacterium]MDP4829792.1 penicillin-binding protein 1A [Burkholderiaceae bacterium]